MSRKNEHHKKHKADDSEHGERKGEIIEGPGQAPAPADQAGELEKLRAERDDLLGRLQRVSADYLNYQKRVQKDIAEAREFANAELIKSFLVVLDDMDRAIQAAKANHAADDPLLAGMQLVHQKAFEVLGRFGLSVIKAQGETFDPDKHAALMQQPTDEYPANTVLSELQKGYQLKGRMIRPASVIVSAPPQPSQPKEQQEQQEKQEDRQEKTE